MTPFPAQLAVLAPVVGVVAIALVLHRRSLRECSQQAWEPARALARVLLLGLVLLLLSVAALTLPWDVGVAEALGAGCGLALGLLGLRQADPRWDAQGGHYTPNPWIGGVLAVLMIGRLVWRGSQGHPVVPTEPHHDFDALTMGLGMTLLAYGLTDALGLWWRMRRLRRHATLAG